MAVRQRLPFPLFLMVLVIALMLAGLACACLTDHPEQVTERMLVAVADLTAPLDLLRLLALGAVVVACVTVSTRRHRAVHQAFRL